MEAQKNGLEDFHYRCYKVKEQQKCIPQRDDVLIYKIKIGINHKLAKC